MPCTYEPAAEKRTRQMLPPEGRELGTGLHRNSAYLERRAALASRSVPSGASDGLPRRDPDVPDHERSQANIPGTHQISMERVMAVLTDKEQACLRVILLARMTAARAPLAGVVCIDADAAASRQDGFVGEQFTQLGKRPAGRMAVGLARFGRDGHQLVALAAVLSAPGALANAGQRFQSDEGVRLGIQDTPGTRVIGAQLPSLQLATGRSAVWSHCECLGAGAVFGCEQSGQLSL